MKRRDFIKNVVVGTAGLAIASPLLAAGNRKSAGKETHSRKSGIKASAGNWPVAVCTWNLKNAVAKAGEVLKSGGNSLDAVEQGTMVEEADETNMSVGKGGRPDRDGHVTLDACIMNKNGDYGAVAYLQNIVHPISVARKVMEKTPHAILAGAGALQFAKEQGFTEENLLTEASEKAWKEWLQKSEYKPVINIENHDTIGMLAIDKNGDISGACTTSGLSYKMAGRVGDSPIIGSGLFVDNEIGCATATGVGEEVLKIVGSFLIVELMRQGKSPQQACEEAIGRIISRNPKYREVQVGFLALNKNGDVGAYCIHEGYTYSMFRNGEITNTASGFFNKI